MAHKTGTDLYFLTGNHNKFLEIKAFIPALKQLDIDLEEIQSLSANDIIQAKLNEAAKYYQAEFIVEDTSLYLDCLNGLPGPLIKWFLQALGCEGLFQMAKKLGNTNATARTIIGYRAGNGNILFFEGALAGNICTPMGNNGFGWDRIFMPEGQNRTFAQMDDAGKQSISMRTIALNKLRDYLDTL